LLARVKPQQEGIKYLRKVKGPAQGIQFLVIKWQDGYHHIPMDVINKITAMCPQLTKKKHKLS